MKKKTIRGTMAGAKVGKTHDGGEGVVIYQAKSGAIELRTDVCRETFWLTQQQVGDMFNVQKAAISKHVKNIFESGELTAAATVSKMETVQTEGHREVKRTVEYYNLDLVLSIGYRVNSKQATAFRQWATKTLCSYITDGFVVDRKRVAKNYDHFLEVVGDIQRLLPVSSDMKPGDAVELVSLFADTWLSLDAYDKDTLPKGKLTKKRVTVTTEKVSAGLANLKKILAGKGEATELFGSERHEGAVSGIVGNVMHTKTALSA